MKTSGYLKRNSTLKSYTPLKRGTSQLKRSYIKAPEMTPQKELDSIVSKAVRLGSADSNGMVMCATCHRMFHWTIIQCGHFQKRQHLATRYDPRNLGPQCEDCNCFKDGKEEEFAEYIDGYYGPGTADELRRLAGTIVHDFPYDQEIMKWEAVLQMIVEKRNGIEY